MYSVTSVFDAERDAGIHWNSAGINWPDELPIVSARDQELPPFSQAREYFMDGQ
jgi:dTDP-4-dehydrorhamnose 3,5-epimerase-like enzyme